MCYEQIDDFNSDSCLQEKLEKSTASKYNFFLGVMVSRTRNVKSNVKPYIIDLSAFFEIINKKIRLKGTTEYRKADLQTFISAKNIVLLSTGQPSGTKAVWTLAETVFIVCDNHKVEVVCCLKL